jgi:DNA polymerase III delta prime subunit
MAKFSHVTIFEGDETIAEKESKNFCIQILGQKFENKIKKSICADVIFIDSQNKKSIGINEVRKIKNDSIIKPVECNFKIYIFKNAQNLTEQAQNALLKIFEEPPKHVIFLLLCNNSKNFIPTLISRAWIVKLNRINDLSSNKDSDNFIDFLVKNNKICVLSVLSKYDSDREKLKLFLNNCKEKILLKIKNQILNINKINLCNKINKSIKFIDLNINKNLILLSIFLE